MKVGPEQEQPAYSNKTNPTYKKLPNSFASSSHSPSRMVTSPRLNPSILVSVQGASFAIRLFFQHLPVLSGNTHRETSLTLRPASYHPPSQDDSTVRENSSALRLFHPWSAGQKERGWRTFAIPSVVVDNQKNYSSVTSNSSVVSSSPSGASSTSSTSASASSATNGSVEREPMKLGASPMNTGSDSNSMVSSSRV